MTDVKLAKWSPAIKGLFALVHLTPPMVFSYLAHWRAWSAHSKTSEKCAVSFLIVFLTAARSRKNAKSESIIYRLTFMLLLLQGKRR